MNTENNNVQDGIIDGAITEVKADNALVTFNPTQYAATAFEPFKKRFSAVKREANRAQFDIMTTQGLKECRGIARSFRELRTGLENARKEAKAPILEAGQKVDAVAKDMTAEIKPFEDKYTKMADDREAQIEAEKQAKLDAERARIEAIEGRIAHIRSITDKFHDAESEVVQAMLDKMLQTQLEPAKYDEHLEEALTAWNKAIDTLRELHTKALAREEEARRVAAERAELERLRAEQAERDRVAAEQKRIADERAAEQQRQMNEMRRAQERTQRIMEDIQNIQQLGLRDGDVLAVLANLQYAESIEITEERFGGMASMAQMAKDMAVSSLQSKYSAAKAAEEEMARQAERDQLAIEAAQPSIAPVELDGTGVIIGAVLVSAGEPADEVEIVQSPVEKAPEDSTRVTRAARNVPPVLRPTDDEILDVLMAYFGKSRGMIAHWLMRMDAGRLLAIAEESGE